LSKQGALRLAQNKGLDLVLVSPTTSSPLVAKIANYSKNKYEQQKKAKEARKHQVTIDVKEVQLSPVIQEHDLQTKLKHAQKFLAKGNHVKVTMKLKGRFITKQDQGRKVVQDFINRLADVSEVQGRVKLTERYFNALLVPKKEE